MGFFDKIKQGLAKTREAISETFNDIFSVSELDDDFYDELEESLILADLGMETAGKATQRLKKEVSARHIRTAAEARQVLQEILVDMLNVGSPELNLKTLPSVILVIGVNGVGKTTTIGKIAKQQVDHGKKVLLVAGDAGGVLPLPKWLMQILNVVINLLRSIPFLILMIMVFPLSRRIVGTTVGTVATIVPLVVAAFPFIARLVESSLREVDPNIIEAAQSMGATPFQIIWKVMLPESVPSLLSNATIAITTILGYSAMSGIIGGGGLGKIAINYGYYRYKYLVMVIAVILLVLIVQLFQSVGTALAVKSDKRLKK